MALYRTYRPATFADVIGQDHVTKPLMAALDAGKINHAYLFSGPRGCGKTSSARIMARSLNCEKGPTSHPCGTCDSCRSLAPGGPGNLDVTELDAASHNGVEDMRELRDRALYAPAKSRYRVFIIDEAHMITAAGANALLKIVEEPPERLVFIFATTEPEKILTTIKSRTHHYPFRLLTPPAMRQLITAICEKEHVHIDDEVIPLVIRAGGGSPRDSLSVLDQLLAGSGDQGLTYELAVPLLGVTDSGLIDAAIGALAAGDQAALFTTVDNVIAAGHDPRRFAADLLDRLRDLMILKAVPEALEERLVDAPAAQWDIFQQEAQAFSASELPRLAALVNDGLLAMRGATSPRLLLEILCARMLLPTGIAGGATETGETAANTGNSGAGQALLQATLARLKNKTSQANEAAAPVEPASATTEASEVDEQESQAQQPEPSKEELAPETEVVVDAGEKAPEPDKLAAQPDPVAPEDAPAARSSSPAEIIRSNWAAVLTLLEENDKVAQVLLGAATVLGIRDKTLVLGHNTGALASALNKPEHADAIARAIGDMTGLHYTVICEVGTRPFDCTTPEEHHQSAQDEADEVDELNDLAWDEDSDYGLTDPEEAEECGVTGEGDDFDPWSDASESVPGASAGTDQDVESDTDSEWDSSVVPVAKDQESWLDETGQPGSSRATTSSDSPKPGSWQDVLSKAREASRSNTGQDDSSFTSFSDGSPVPPEPVDEGFSDVEDVPPVDEEALRRAEEADMVAAAAGGPGDIDHRDALTVAVELLQSELGATKL